MGRRVRPAPNQQPDQNFLAGAGCYGQGRAPKVRDERTHAAAKPEYGFRKREDIVQLVPAPLVVRLGQQMEGRETRCRKRVLVCESIQIAPAMQHHTQKRLGTAEQLQTAEPAARKCLQMAPIHGLGKKMQRPPTTRVPCCSPRAVEERVVR